ncbi:MAG: hypothetical protein ABTQ32_18365 [Myxococcaceae bacterium]
MELGLLVVVVVGGAVVALLLLMADAGALSMVSGHMRVYSVGVELEFETEGPGRAHGGDRPARWAIC